MTIKPLAIKDLYKECNTEWLDFKNTNQLEDLDSHLGQEKAIKALNFCVNIKSKGYNAFCIGSEGTGKTSLTLRMLKAAAAKLPDADDWCYVNNFNEPHRPHAISLPTGMASEFAKDIDKLIKELIVAVPATFEGEEYRNRLKMIDERFQNAKSEYFDDLQKSTSGKNVSILRMPVGLVVAPTRDGEILTPEAFDKLPKDEQEEILQELNEKQAELEEAVRSVPKWEQEQREAIKKINEEGAKFAVGHPISELKKKYKKIADVVSYLNNMEKDIIENVEMFLSNEKNTEEEENIPPSVLVKRINQIISKRYQVNILVKNKPKVGAPVVYVDHPIVPNVFGKMERIQQYGALISDFNLIKSGALHKANGGFIAINARELMSHPNTWETLKRALKTRKISFENHDEESSFTTISLEPEAIPLNIKVILIGSPEIYYLLSEADPEFKELFKVEANFNHTMERTKSNITKYASLIATLSRKEDLKILNRDAVARVIEYASRLSGSGDKLTTHIQSILDIIREANFYAEKSKAKLISRAHVDEAIYEKMSRSDRLQTRMMEQIIQGTLLIDTKGKRVGQINALVVFEFAQETFGRPSRITCQVRMGRGNIIDIEREVEMGGPSHTKGVFIISSFIGTRYSKERPLSLDASLVFEQSYGEVDGDSASSTELYAILSALSDAPIGQNFAVTGSVNQFGEIQAIGGVNEKIEGFFDVCKIQGLTGDQGVLIPKSNVANLMLKDEVVEACKKGKFKIYAVSHIDEGIEILTGIPAGKMDKKGNYPKDSINGRVQAKLEYFHNKSMEYSECDNKKGE